MINSIHIQSYKLFKSFIIKKLPKILLIGGKNNCGKTSFLEAIFFLLSYRSSDMFMRLFQWRGIETIDQQSIFAASYHKFKLKQPIVFEYTLNLKPHKREYKFLPSFIEPLNLKPHEKIINLPSPKKSPLGMVQISHWLNANKKPYKANLTLDLQGMRLENHRELINNHPGIEAFFMATNTKASEKENAELYSELDRKNKTDGILPALQIIEPKLKLLSVITQGDRPALYGDIGLEQKIPLSLMGQGIVRLVSILLRVASCPNGILLVDELENGFHHSILKDVWSFIAHQTKKYNTQLIATTHSQELMTASIEGLPKDIRSDFKYMRIEREKDSFKTKIYDFEILKTALETQLETR